MSPGLIADGRGRGRATIRARACDHFCACVRVTLGAHVDVAVNLVVSVVLSVGSFTSVLLGAGVSVCLNESAVVSVTVI